MLLTLGYRHDPTSKPHPSVSTTSSFSTSASYTITSSYKPPPSDATMATAEDSNEAINTDTSNGNDVI